MKNLYCPITGQQVLQPDDYFPSPALDFIYLDEFDCFQYMRPELMAKYPEHFDGDETIKEAGSRILDYVIGVASGTTTVSAVRHIQDDFIPWKRGVSL